MALRRDCSLIALSALAGACTGPALHIDNPGGHTVFVDGTATTAATLPFRYYGTTRWHALPKDVGGRTDWQLQANSQAVPVPPPASPLLFPLDLPLELLARLLHGRTDTTTRIELLPTPFDPRIETETANAELARLLARAIAARTSR